MKLRIVFTALLFAMSLTATLIAHHSINAEFDSSKSVTLDGTITNVDWMNPHTYVFVDVKDPVLRKTRTWACELASPNELARRGFTRESLKVGMTVRVMGSRAKDGSLKIHIETLAAENGVSLAK
jgi:hypothetical protein